MAPLLMIQGLTLAYAGRRVLNGIDLALAPGETLALTLTQQTGPR